MLLVAQINNGTLVRHWKSENRKTAKALVILREDIS